jgi:hypothetical protein
MNILVLVISSDTLPIYKLDKEVWMSYMNKFPNIDSYFIEYRQSDESTIIIENNTIYFQGEECFENIIHKTLNSIDFCLARKKYDFIVRTNLSTVCDFTLLEKYLSELPTKEKIYSGHHGPYYNLETFRYWFDFIGGMGIIMSKDVCEMILEPTNRQMVENFKNMDDIDIGYLMYYHHIPIIGMKYYIIDSLDQFNNSISIIHERKYIFYRVKNHGNRENEAECMRQIISILYSI